MFEDIFWPKNLKKLIIIAGIQELKVPTDTNDRAFVKRWICMSLFWWQETDFCWIFLQITMLRPQIVTISNKPYKVAKAKKPPRLKRKSNI